MISDMKELKKRLKELLQKVRHEYPRAAKLRVEYSGNGDEGYVGSVYVGDGGESDDEVRRCYPPDYKDVDPLWREFDDVFCSLLHEQKSGWDQNDGSTGTFEIDLATDKCVLRHSWYETVEDPDPAMELAL